jgi:hypothetical protein
MDGGKAAPTKEQRQAIARKAAVAGWGKKNQPTPLRDPQLAERWEEGV